MCQLQSAHSLYTHDAQYNPVMWPWEHLQVRKNWPIRAILLSRRFKVQHKPHWGALFLHHGAWRGGVGGHPASKVPQCVQAVGNTWVQWFPTNTREQVELLKLLDRNEVTKHGASGDHLNSAILMSTVMIYLSLAFVILLKDLEYKDLIYGWFWFTTTTE